VNQLVTVLLSVSLLDVRLLSISSTSEGEITTGSYPKKKRNRSVY